MARIETPVEANAKIEELYELCHYLESRIKTVRDSCVFEALNDKAFTKLKESILICYQLSDTLSEARGWNR
jgi:hypothetical protein